MPYMASLRAFFFPCIAVRQAQWLTPPFLNLLVPWLTPPPAWCMGKIVAVNDCYRLTTKHSYLLKKVHAWGV